MTILAEYKNLHGATITFGTHTTCIMEVIGFDEPERSSQEIEDVDLSSTVKKSFASKVLDEGELSLVCRYKPGATLDPINLVGGDDETITVTYPLRATEATAAYRSFTGHVTKAGGVKAANEGRCERTVTIKVNSAVSFTAAT